MNPSTPRSSKPKVWGSNPHRRAAPILLLALAGCPGGAPPPDRGPPAEAIEVQGAKAFAAQMGEADIFLGVSCVERDSDGDGYVSCTIFRKGKDPIALECAYGGFWSAVPGCKMAQPKMRAVAP